jgi:uncharacterized glyoxalase superfamily protein PhnB
MAKISAMLIVPDADGAIAWYERALGATQMWNLGGVAGSRRPLAAALARRTALGQLTAARF